MLILSSAAMVDGQSTVGKDLPRTKIVLVKDGTSPVYDVSGGIDPGADKAFAELVGDRFGGTLVLRSMGDHAYTSILIGRLARTHKIKTYVPANTYCLSGPPFRENKKRAGRGAARVKCGDHALSALLLHRIPQIVRTSLLAS